MTLKITSQTKTKKLSKNDKIETISAVYETMYTI